ncbi:MAG: hypothetical protein IKY39_05510 [Clostridia bacterium]|nr:hypothetical protein [Clostridia bacterium]
MSDDIFIKKIYDVVRLAEKYRSPRFSKFLDETQQAIIKSEGIFGGITFGGYDGSERKVFGAFPDWQEPSFDEFPIAILKFTKKYEKELNHRHYLGTILSLGIERNKIGDILPEESGATIFVLEDIAEFIKENITKIAGCGVDIDICDSGDVKIPEKRFELIDIVAASLRLDACLGAILKISRKDAKNLALSGKVLVNHLNPKSEDTKLNLGDLLSIRGFGRVEILETGGRTRSDRVHITVKKYI